MNYIKVTIGMPLTLSIDKSGNTKWYVNEEYAVHKDKRSHTYWFMTIGTDEAYIKFSKKKLNTKSLTKAKLVGVNNVLTQVIWNQ